MQNDICTVAFDKKVNIIIVPFHKVWSISCEAPAGSNQLRSVNRNMLKNAPCLVGVLVDKSETYATALGSELYHRICLLFMGGVDDLEALAYAKRMAEHPHVSLTVVLFRARGSNEYKKEKIKRNDCENYEITILRNKLIGINIVILGKDHDLNSPVTLGLTEWSKYPELRVLGDMLASSDYRFSVLIVQQ